MFNPNAPHVYMTLVDSLGTVHESDYVYESDVKENNLTWQEVFDAAEYVGENLGNLVSIHITQDGRRVYFNPKYVVAFTMTKVNFPEGV